MIHLKRPGCGAIYLLILAVIILSFLLLDTSSESPVIATSVHRGVGDIEGSSDRGAEAGARLRIPAQRPHKPVAGDAGVEHSSSGTGNALTASVPLQAVLDAIASGIASSASSFDVAAARSELGLQLGDITPEGYASELRTTFREFFVSDRTSTRHPDLLDTVLAHLSVLPHPSEPIPKEIYTTDLRPRDQLPEQFASWARENHGWKVQFMDDRDIDKWLDEQLPAAGVGVEMKALGGKRGVVRADLFRYLVLLLHGGVYTDTDTACVRPFDTWTMNHDTHAIHPLLASLPHLLSLIPASTFQHSPPPTPNPPADISEGDEQGHSVALGVDDGPSLIVAIESDAPASGDDWRGDSFTRGLQVVQWTLVSKRGHPVMLDVLGRGLRQAKELRLSEEAEAAEAPTEDDGERSPGRGDVSAPDILDWTGPGVFTDAVLRYLLVRYGVHPKTLSGLVRPLRIGDVVVMPLHSFRADASEGYQGDYRAVWHGFFGRWKSDE